VDLLLREPIPVSGALPINACGQIPEGGKSLRSNPRPSDPAQNPESNSRRLPKAVKPPRSNAKRRRTMPGEIPNNLDSPTSPLRAGRALGAVLRVPFFRAVPFPVRGLWAGSPREVHALPGMADLSLGSVFNRRLLKSISEEIGGNYKNINGNSLGLGN